MYLALFLVSLLYLYIVREEKTRFWKYAILGSALILCPLTGWIIDRYFQMFYDSTSIQWILPVFGIIAVVVVDIYSAQTVVWKKYAAISTICLLFLLSGSVAYNHSYAKDNENVSEINEVFDLILDMESEREITLVAPRKIMEIARAYDGRILTAYGKDIWENDLDYAFYGNYEEWAYALSQYMDKPVEANKDILFEQLVKSGATHVVFSKENLIFNEDMNYPNTIKHESMKLKRIEETHHYVIYAATN